MADEKTPDNATAVELDDLATYLVVGVHRDTHEVVAASSPSMTLPDMGMLLGRLITDLMVNVAGAGAFDAIRAARQQSQKPQSNIVSPFSDR